MATILRIKRSETSGNPSVLAAGELAYSGLTDNGSNGGDRLYIGMGVETLGDAANHLVIGGKYFTDMMDHNRGTLTASSALIVDANKKIDDFYVDDIQINSATISTTTADTDLSLSPNGTGKVSITKNLEVDGDLKIDGGDITLTDSATNIAIKDNEAAALTIKEGSNNYITVKTTDADESITLHKITTITSETSTTNAVSTVLRVEHATSGSPANGIGTGIQLVTETTGNNLEVGVTLEAVAADTTNGQENFDFVVRTMTAGASAAQALKINNNTVQIGSNNTSTTMTTLGTSDLTLSTNSGTNSGTIKINNGSNGDIVVAPNGTGDIQLDTDTVRVGDSNTTATITSNGTGDLVLNTNGGTNSGSITIVNGADGNITIATNGTGDVYVNADTLRVGDNNAAATITTNGTGNLVLNTNTGTDSGSITINQGANANIAVDPNGTGKVRFYNAYSFPGTDGTVNQVLTTNGSGILSWAASSSSLAISDDVTPTAGTDNIALLTETLVFAGGEGIDTAVTANTVTISMELATAAANVGSSNIGGSSFSSGNFDVTSGFVTIKTGGISNSNLANSSITVGTTSISLGSTSTTLAGITQLDADNIRLDGNTISSTDLNGNITLNPNGTGVVDVSSTRIINLAEPQNDSDAATKYYVDAARSGLDIKQSVRLATATALTATYDNGTVSVGGTLTNSGTQAALEIDGVAVSVGNRILVKDQSGGDAIGNGIYVVTDAGSVSTNWILTRSTDADNISPIGEVTSGMFVFVEAGTVNSDCGFVLTTNDPITLGTTQLSYTLFSTSGTLIAGNGLSKDGYTLKVNVDAIGGIEINSDNLRLKSTVAGNGLTYTDGVIAVGGTADRITVTGDAIDISSSYVGQATITTLGTIATGVWQGTAVAAAYGGTGQTSYAIGDVLYASSSTALSKRTIGTSGQVLQVALVGSDLIPVWAHLDGGTY